jgi:hypothetical protein
VGQDGILRPVVNQPVADEQHRAKSADAIGAQDAIVPHSLWAYYEMVHLKLGYR